MYTAGQYLSDPSLGLVREVRSSQLQMATSIEGALKQGGVYCGEAGTGVGKSFAYLLPSLLEPRRRIVVATAKKTLQDQLLEKDIPAIVRIVGESRLRLLGIDPENDGPIAIALKGKSNYACQALAEEFDRGPDWTRFIKTSKYGDKADYDRFIPKWWYQATADDCTASCPFHEDCGYRRLRKDVAGARVVVVNHHLLGFDICYGQGAGAVLGGAYDTVIVDEAHKLTEGLRNAFSQKVSQQAALHLRKAIDKLGLTSEAMRQPLEEAWADMFKALPKGYFTDAYTREIPVFPQGADTVLEYLGGIEHSLYGTIRAEVGQDFENWGELRRLADDLVYADEEMRKNLVKMTRAWHRTNELCTNIRVLQGQVEVEKTNVVIYSVVEENESTGARELHIIRAPIVMGPLVSGFFSTLKTVVLTSATLAVYDQFDHIPSVIGRTPTQTEILASPFKFQGVGAQGFIYVPNDIPFLSRPNQRKYADPADFEQAQRAYDQSVSARVQRALHLVKASGGGAFVLTTANSELDIFADVFKAALPGQVFVQGHSKNPWDGPPPVVFDKFKARGPDAVLIGSKSFWEGVDVVGEQLRLVIIAKLPFPMPGDPVVEARIKYWQSWALAQDMCDGVQDAYWWAWRRVHMGDMVMDLRQGVGRLIRAKTDFGAVAILDNRLWTANYAKKTRLALSFAVSHDLSLCDKMLPRYAQYFRNRVVPNPCSNGQANPVRPLPGATAGSANSAQADAEPAR